MKTSFANIRVVSLLIIILTITFTNINATWLDNVSTILRQPDGTKIEVFSSGDEFHNWVHDAEGYTIVKDPKTGYWCWASRIDPISGEIQSSGRAIHTTNRQALSINPGINISEEKYLSLRETSDIVFNSVANLTPRFGVVTNLVIWVRFADDNDDDCVADKEFGTQPGDISAQEYVTSFIGEGTGVNSLYQYIWDASYNQLEVKSYFTPGAGANFIASYQDIHPRSAYVDRVVSRNTLLLNAYNYVASNIFIPPNINFDIDNNGVIDNIIFMVRGQHSNALWSHAGTLNSPIKIHKCIIRQLHSLCFLWEVL